MSSELLPDTSRGLAFSYYNAWFAATLGRKSALKPRSQPVQVTEKQIHSQPQTPIYSEQQSNGLCSTLESAVRSLLPHLGYMLMFSHHKRFYLTSRWQRASALPNPSDASQEESPLVAPPPTLSTFLAESCVSGHDAWGLVAVSCC